MKNKKMVFGIDLGMGACKLVGEGGGVHLPSHVGMADGRFVAGMAGMKAQAAPVKITVGNHSFYVGDGAHEWGRPVESLDYERLNGSPEIRAIFYAAVTEYVHCHAVINLPVVLYVGMPLESLTGDRAVATVTAVKGWLMGRHEWAVNDDLNLALDVADVRITSQPSGALFDYLLDDNGRFVAERKADFKKEIGIISVGFNTVELLVVKETQPVQRFTAGATVGVRRLLDLINQNGYYSLGELDTQLRAGQLDVKTAVPIWAREITGLVEQKWGGSWRRFARIVAVGGGALILNGQLAFEGRAVVPDAPVMAIARGLYKLALMQGQGK